MIYHKLIKPYNFLTKKDVKEIDNVIDFATNLIIKNQNTADLQENADSMRQASYLINSKLEVDYEPEEREKYINNYVELNPYYKELKDNYNIDYFESRIAKDLYILKPLKKTLSREEESLFYKCYYSSLNYYNKVISTKAFNNQKLNRFYILYIIIFHTIQRYITLKMEFYFNIDTYDLPTLKNAFISNGLDYFDSFPINYQRRLLKLITDLLPYKGTNHAIKDIINMFGFKNLDIYKYVLCRYYPRSNETGKIQFEKPELIFYKTPAEKEINTKRDLQLNYHSIVDKDAFWQCNEKEVSSKEFNLLNSKYLSVDATIGTMQENMTMSYFMSLLYKMEKDYKEKQDKDDFGFVNKKISLNPIGLFDSIVALQSLAIRKNGFKDIINKTPDEVHYIFGYNNIESNEDVSDLIREIKILVIQKERELKKGNKFNILFNYFNNFKLKNFNKDKDFDRLKFIDRIMKDKKVSSLLKDFFSELGDKESMIRYVKLWEDERITNKEEKASELLLKTLNQLEDNKYTLNKYHKYDKIYDLFDSVLLNINTQKVFTISDFMGIFKYNEALRHQLEDFLVECNDYRLYRKYQKLENEKMLSHLNVELYGDCETFKDFVFKRNKDLYKYIMIPEEYKDDDKYIEQFYINRIFELVESIDNYIGGDYQFFVNSNFIGMLDFIKKYLYIVVSVFKSYTIDLLESNLVLKLNDRNQNTLKLFDECNITEKEVMTGYLDMMDICNVVYSGLDFKEGIQLSDKFIIREDGK